MPPAEWQRLQADVIGTFTRMKRWRDEHGIDFIHFRKH